MHSEQKQEFNKTKQKKKKGVKKKDQTHTQRLMGRACRHM